MAGDGETMSNQCREETFDKWVKGIGEYDSETNELISATRVLFVKYGEDGLDAVLRMLDLVKSGCVTKDNASAYLEEYSGKSHEEYIKRLAHEHREEQRLDLMLAYCRETGESLDDFEKETRGMRSHQVIEHLAIKKYQAEYEATNQ